MGSLVSPEELRAILPEVTVLDVRWRLGRTDGYEQYVAGHVPGAVYVDLETDPADVIRCRTRTGSRPPCVAAGCAVTARWWCTTTPRGPRRPGPGGCCATTGTRTSGCSTVAGRGGSPAWLVGVARPRWGRRNPSRVTWSRTRGTCRSS